MGHQPPRRSPRRPAVAHSGAAQQPCYCHRRGVLGPVHCLLGGVAGGVDPAHAQLAAHTAETACVLVVVCDATTPLTAPEMEFIRGASATVDSVVVAVTKTDKNLRRWQPIAAENRRLLQQHLRRQIPVVGVSSLRALAAADHPDPARRLAGEQASGIAELRAEIRTRLDPRCPRWTGCAPRSRGYGRSTRRTPPTSRSRRIPAARCRS